MHHHFNLNMIMIACYLFFLAISKWSGFVFPLYFFGLLIFFLPGLNLALALKRLTVPMGRAKIILWSFLFSILLTPSFILRFPLNSEKVAQEKETLLAFFLLLFITLAIFLLSLLFKNETAAPIKLPSFRRHRIFWTAFSIFIASLFAHFILYPFIPEADGYGYLQAAEKSIATGTFANFDSRKIFLVFSWTLFHLTKIPLFMIYKIILPFLGIFTWLVFFKISASLFRSRWKIILFSLSPLFFPIYALDILIPRPQLIFSLIFPIYLYLLEELKKLPFRKTYPSHLILLFLAFCGMQFHQIFIFLPAIQISFLAILFCQSQNPRFYKSYLLPFGAIIFFIILLKFSSFGTRIADIFLLISNNFSLSNFRFWFIDDYIDIYGEQMGWPGFSALYYYGFNLGFVFPLILLSAILKKIGFDFKNNLLCFFSFCLFILFAEILPRFGLAYVPNRMWLFASLSLAFLLPPLFQKLENILPEKKLFRISVFLVSCSLILNWSLTYEKQGWITLPEYYSARFIKNQTEENAVFLSQGGNFIALNYFGQRSLVVPSGEFFLKNFPDKDEMILANLNNIFGYPLEKNIRPSERIPTLMHRIYADDELAPDFKTPSAPESVYIFYSTGKFDGLKGGRPWWREMNFYGADLEKFDNAEMYEKVYDEGGVKIWKVKQ